MGFWPEDDYLPCCKVVKAKHVKYGSYLNTATVAVSCAAEIRASQMTLHQQVSSTRAQSRKHSCRQLVMRQR